MENDVFDFPNENVAGSMDIETSSNVAINSSIEITDIRSKLSSGDLKLNRIAKRSWIWNHMSRVYDPTKKVDLAYIACNKCKDIFIEDKTGGTGKYAAHLMKQHSIKSSTDNESTSALSSSNKQVKLSTFLQPTSISKVHNDRIIDQLLKLSVDCCLPFDVCCRESMMDLICATLKIDGLSREEQAKIFRMCDESTLRKIKLPKKFDEISSKIKENVKKICSGHGGVTLDLWSDKYRHREYFALTFHFLDNDFVLTSYCLACRQIFDAKITHAVLAKHIKSILSEYDLDPKNMTFVTDSGANVKAVFESTGWSRIACFAHDLNLLVSADGFGSSSESAKVPQIEKLISDCKSIVLYFKRGNGQRRLEEKGGTALKTDVPSRWNSTFTMLKSIEKNFDLVYQVLIEKKEEHLIARVNRHRLRKLVNFLEPFYQLTCKFSSQSKETLAEVWGTVMDLTEYLNSRCGQLDLEADEDASEFEDLEQLKMNMRDGLESLTGRNHKRLAITDSHQIATVLDPRQKRLLFLDNDSRRAVYEKVIAQLQQIAAEKYQNQALSQTSSSIEQEEASASTAQRFGGSRFYVFSTSSQDEELDARQEFESYLANNFAVGYTECTMTQSDFPFVFWRQKGDQWPKLKLIAFKYLAIPATSVPSEQIFSLANRILTDRRSMLSGKVLEMSVFCKKNIKER